MNLNLDFILKRGLKKDLPKLPEGKPAFTTDTKELFIGSNTGNVKLAKQDDLDNKANMTDLESVNTYLTDIALNVKKFGVKGDGKTDDTINFQTALNAAVGGELRVPSGTYMINAVTSLNIPSNIRIILHPNAVIRAIANSVTYYNVFKLTNVSNVVIQGGTIQGERSTHTGTTGEWGMGIDVEGCSNITLKDVTIRDCWGDGLYIAETTGFLADNIVCDNNRRNGISITDNNTNITVRNSEIKNTNGTDPQNGIDIEPNDNTKFLNKIVIDNCYVHNNAGAGIQIPNFAVDIQRNIKVLNCHVESNTLHGIYLTNATGVTLFNNKVENCGTGIYLSGNILRLRIIDCTVNKNGWHQLFAQNTSSDSFNDIEIIGGSYTNAPSGKDGINMTVAAGNVMKNIRIISVTASDTQATHTQRYGIVFVPSTSPNFVYGLSTEGNVTGASNIGSYVQKVDNITGSVAYSPPSLANGAQTTTSLTVPGANLGDFAVASFSQSLSGITITSYVAQTNTVVVVFTNNSGVTQALPTGTLRVKVFNQ